MTEILQVRLWYIFISCLRCDCLNLFSIIGTDQTIHWPLIHSIIDNIFQTSSDQRLELCIHMCTSHIWSTLVAFKWLNRRIKLDQMSDNGLQVKLN